MSSSRLSLPQLLQGIDRLLDKVGTRNVTTRPPMPSDETVVEQRIKVRSF